MLGYALLFLSATLASYLIAFPTRWLALRFDVVDHPAKRKMHQLPIPLLGGLPIFLSFVTVSLVGVLAWRGGLEGSSVGSYAGLLAGGAIIVLLGLYDDVRGISPPVKFGGQLLAAGVVVAAGARINLFTNPLGESFHLGWLGVPLAIFWIVGVTNAMNLIDGLDGLAAGIGGIAALGLFAVAAPENPFVATTTIILAGATIGFLKHNFYPAKLFLGDTGSMFLGFTLSVIGLHGSYKATTATVLFLPIIVLGVPIFDTLFAITRRAKRRVSPFKADREHIHHRLVRIGLHHRNVVLVMYFVCAYLALTAYSIAQFPYQTAFLFLLLLTMGGIIGLRTLQFVEARLETLHPELQTAVPAEMRPPQPRTGNGAGRPAGRRAAFNTLICEVSGFRDEPGSAAHADALRADITSMLTRRVRVDSVVIEATAPGGVILIVRTEPLKPAMTALVKDGLAWYFEDHRERYSSDPSFPIINWIRTTPSPRASTDQPAGQKDERGVAGPVSLKEGRAGVIGS